MSLNKCCLIGNLGKEPEIRTMKNSKEVDAFSLATSENWKDIQSGEKKTKTEWNRIVIYNSGLVGIVKQYVNKGSKLYLEGKIQYRKWTDSKGVEKYAADIVLQGFNCSLQMLGSKDFNSTTKQNINN